MATTGDDARRGAAGGAELRPMRDADVEAVFELATVSFRDLDERMGNPAAPPRDRETALIRYRQPLRTDPGGAWVAELDGQVVAAGEAIDREGVWGLSLLVVHPDHQSRGVGGAVLRRTLEYASGGVRGGIILSSEDPRAMRAYARAGFDLDPAISAMGRVRVPPRAPASVRDGGRADIPAADAIGRAVRGAGHAPDLPALLDARCRLRLVPDRGFAVTFGADVVLLAALDDDAARDLLRATLADAGGGESSVSWITSRQRWAVPVVLEAGLELRFGGAVLTRGDVGAFAPYIPSGAYL